MSACLEVEFLRLKIGLVYSKNTRNEVKDLGERIHDGPAPLASLGDCAQPPSQASNLEKEE
jgi:hypothetical protein